jgi:hypothetical protein
MEGEIATTQNKFIRCGQRSTVIQIPSAPFFGRKALTGSCARQISTVVHVDLSISSSVEQQVPICTIRLLHFGQLRTASTGVLIGPASTKRWQIQIV